MNKLLLFRGLLVIALVIAAIFALSYDYTQDDAFISYRYVANFLNGDGLVYNTGERVEGFTNFGWVIWLILWGALGANFLVISKFTGLFFGLGVVLLSALIARRSVPDHPLMAGLVALIVAVNPSLAYWVPAGLETAAFSFFTLLSIYFWLRHSDMLIWSILMSVWLRPEGALIAGLLILIETITTRRLATHALRSTLIALLLSLPYVAFKLGYYGSILPNPFYAKTGWSMEQLMHGADYLWLYLQHYALYGVVFILPLLVWKSLQQPLRRLYLFYLLFTLYIVLVGGDVLEVHRFFIPLLGLNALLIVVPVHVLFQNATPKVAPYLTAILTLGIVAVTWFVPRSYIAAYYEAGEGLNNKMSFLAERLKQIDSSDFSVAASTIGVFGYELLGHDLIDLVGLTDTIVSRHPQDQIDGLATAWREPHYNTAYLLECAPDYIIFSTGVKPTAPGEKALFLYDGFLKSYRTIGFSYRSEEDQQRGALTGLFRKIAEPSPLFTRTHPAITVELFQRAVDAANAGRHTEAIARFDSARALSPQPVNPYLQYRKGLSYLMQNQHESAMAVMDSLLVSDSSIFEAHKDLYLYARLLDDSAKADIHARWIQKLTPWYWPRAKEIADDEVAQYRAARRQRSRP